MSPAAIAPMPLARPETSTGLLLSVVVPLPSWPEPLEPQHLTPPSLVSAHVWSRPAAIAVIAGLTGGDDDVWRGVVAGSGGVTGTGLAADGPAATSRPPTTLLP